MRKQLVVLALLLLASIPAAVAADVDKGLYIGGGLGQSGISDSEGSFDFSGDDSGWKAILGWRIFKFFAVEANWVDFGTPSDTISGIDVDVTADGLDLSAMGILPLGGHFELFVKGGYMAWDASIDSDDPTLDASDDGEDIFYGGGAAFRLGKSFQIRVEYEEFEIDDTDAVDLTSASATFTF